MTNRPHTPPEYGVPDEESPEWTERDFAFSKRRDGTWAFPELHARYVLADLRDDLSAVTDKPKMKNTLRHVEAALAEMKEG